MAERDKVKSRVTVDVRLRPEILEKTSMVPPTAEAILSVADWTDDPGVGKAVLLEDGSEVLNPVPMAPPVGYAPEPSIMEMIDQAVKRNLAMGVDPDEVIDEEAELNDFLEDEEFDPASVYEINVQEMEEDAPILPPAPVPPPEPVPEPPEPVVSPAPIPPA